MTRSCLFLALGFACGSAAVYEWPLAAHRSLPEAAPTPAAIMTAAPSNPARAEISGANEREVVLRIRLEPQAEAAAAPQAQLRPPPPAP